MKRLFFVYVSFLFIIVIGTQIFAVQERAEYQKAMVYLNDGNEVYLRFFNTDRTLLSELTSVISLDNVKNQTEVYAYANTKGFEKFLEYNLYYEVLTHPGDLLEDIPMSDDPDVIRQSWDVYPTLAGYYDMMEGFASEYPDKCKIIQIGKSNLGRKLLYAVVSDSINVKEAEPRVMYTSSMHGDETTFYVNYLRLIDYLLSEYNSDDFVKKLVDNVEIWICPLENPDGTYRNSDVSVLNARRQNSNGVDLNRHFPQAGERNSHPDGALAYEPECQYVLDLLDTCQFVISMNCHGGAELLNYPFDFRSKLHPDDEWMKYVYREYTNTVHAINPNYMTGQNNGITNGYQWYQIFGSRMDHVTWSRFCKEVTAEMSSTKLVSATNLPKYWNYNYEALLEYIEQALFGINGTVTCASSGVGLKAKVYVKNHDEDSSFTVSKLPCGDFWRPIYKGTYSVEFSCDDYLTETIENVSVQNDKATVLEVKLDPATPIGEEHKGLIHNAPLTITPHVNGQVTFAYALSGNTDIALFDLSGRLVRSFPQSTSLGKSCIVWDGLDMSDNPVGTGCYLVYLTNNNKTMTKSFILSR